MFSEGRTLDWGWVAADRDAGPALSFVDWSPDADVSQGCGNYALRISVAAKHVRRASHRDARRRREAMDELLERSRGTRPLAG